MKAKQPGLPRIQLQDFITVRWLSVHYRAWFSPRGGVLIWVTIIGAWVTGVSLYFFTYMVPSFTFTLLASALALSFFFRPKVVARRLLPFYPSAGEVLVYQVVVKNLGRRLLKDLSVCEGMLPRGLYALAEYEGCSGNIDCLASGEEATLKLALKCSLRGAYELTSLLVGTSFPSGLMRWPRRASEKDKLIVYPRFLSQTDFQVPLNRMYQPGGILLSSNIGNSTEFLSMRDYREGDRLRDLHWPSFARTGRLIVKECLDEYFVRIGLILDTELPKSEARQSFERRISIAAGIADSIAHRDYIIDLFAAGETVHHFQFGRALAHLENLLELLSCLVSVRQVDFRKVQAHLMDYLTQLSSIVILLRDWDASRADFCRVISESGLSVRVIVIRDQDLTIPPDRELTLVPATGGEGLIR